MKKLAFEGVANFEMPKMEKVGLEKENNIVYAGVTVYEPSNGGGFSATQLRAYAEREELVLADSSSPY